MIAEFGRTDSQKSNLSEQVCYVVLFWIVAQHSQLRWVPQPSPGFSRRFYKTPWQTQLGYCCHGWINQCHLSAVPPLHLLVMKLWFPAFHSYHCNMFDGDFKFSHPFWEHCSGSVARDNCLKATAWNPNKINQAIIIYGQQCVQTLSSHLYSKTATEEQWSSKPSLSGTSPGSSTAGTRLDRLGASRRSLVDQK